MTDLVIKLKPRTFKEIIPLVALYRPGPLGSGMVEDYVNRKHGVTRVEYLLPELEELTAETLGVIVYQDQVLQIANQLAGYSLGEADLLRRAMGKKKAEEMAKQRERFVSGATARNIDKAKAEEVFELIAKFAELRLREVAFDGLRADHLPDGLSEGEPPARVPGGAAHHRVRQPRQARALHRARAREGHRDPAARRERVGARLHHDGRRHPLRFRRGQERRRRRDRGDRRGARRERGPLPAASSTSASASTRSA